MYERNPDTDAWDFSHNPFSMPQGGLEALTTQDPGDILAYQYDLVCNGVELSSGAVRNHLPEVMEAAFAIAGYGPDRIKESFPALWNAFHYGPPPHAGIAPGFDRILMLLEDQANLREVIAFPLNQARPGPADGCPERGVRRPASGAASAGRAARPVGAKGGSTARGAARALAPGPEAPVGSAGTSVLMEGRIVPFLDPLRPII